MREEGSIAITRKAVRQALKAWPDSHALGGLPLAALGSVQQQREQAGHADTAAGRGIALRHLLQTAVFTLNPAPEPLSTLNQASTKEVRKALHGKSLQLSEDNREWNHSSAKQ